ncbi:hypothetical protein I552_0708 [Mycobacterium xenopi 3993]|nr:hypothetical protein I552_0708 [Mycobacterium xenopi 3993]
MERQAFQVARLIACEAMPYYSAGLFSLQPVAAPGLNTFAVDKYWRLYLDPTRLIGRNSGRRWWPVARCCTRLGICCAAMPTAPRRCASPSTTMRGISPGTPKSMTIWCRLVLFYPTG